MSLMLTMTAEREGLVVEVRDEERLLVLRAVAADTTLRVKEPGKPAEEVRYATTEECRDAALRRGAAVVDAAELAAARLPAAAHAAADCGGLLVEDDDAS